MVQRLDWDSDFFGFEVGLINDTTNESIFSFANKDYELIYHQSHLSTCPIIHGYYLCYSEKKITFSKKITSGTPLCSNIVRFNETRHNIEDLYKLAHVSGQHSRFFLDKKFKSSSFFELYNTWVDKSVDCSIADYVLVYEVDQQVIGFITAKFDNPSGRAKIGLLGIDEKSQGKGVGSSLIRELETIAYQNNIFSIDVPTQKHNNLACAFYKKKGYLENQQIYINHYWKHEDTV
ncbi:MULTISPECIES: GNAT family N-acetyltransferase [Sphingobacterium]|uniref:GNAT family N-acetyltransferase n=1 Tax=Sphingobacterium populi TaxID=1812824 RepID=A0ABW5UCH1_9SPHI|nr:GNAT family N-acetyltransferase [Sphingobacterium sp. CFCC 11742]